MISIITTSYNYSEYISETIKSVLAQTYSDWELIIVDDFSTDNSIEKIKPFCEQDKRIKLICHDKNKGLIQSIKTGLKYAQGEWIAFLESDDTFLPNTLEIRINHLNNSDIIFNNVLLFGDENLINKKIPSINKTRKILNSIKFPTNIFKEFETRNIIVTLSSVMIKKSLITPQSLNSPTDELFDWWFYIHITKFNTVNYLPQELTNWRIHPDSYIAKNRKSSHKLVNTLAYFDIFKQVKDFDTLKLTFCSLFKMIFIRIIIRLFNKN